MFPFTPLRILLSPFSDHHWVPIAMVGISRRINLKERLLKKHTNMPRETGVKYPIRITIFVHTILFLVLLIYLTVIFPWIVRKLEFLDF